MGLRHVVAQGISQVSTWGLKHLFRRPAANFPGKAALFIDPQVIAGLTSRLLCGSVVVCGTNGKTTTTNLLADALEASGASVICNRTGANLDSGIATALLQGKPSDWGVFECDELWVAKVLPQLESDYLLLLNLFRDQLDRVGEIDRIQKSIEGALAASPKTVLVYNADDPLCAAIASRVANASVAFGTAEDMGLAQNTVTDAQMCQKCTSMLRYTFRQYGQLGDYCCERCGFARKDLDWKAQGIDLADAGVAFTALGSTGVAERVRAPAGGAYMVYNLLATFAAATLLGCPPAAFRAALGAFNPQNGRLEEFEVAGRPLLLNLAKNPTGFNQNLKIIAADKNMKAVAFFVNDKEGDGRDVSWLWDIDFEELARMGGCVAFVGGIRRNDLQVRLKYAGIAAELVDGAAEVFGLVAALPPSARLYLIANYTALPGVRAEVVALAARESEGGAV